MYIPLRKQTVLTRALYRLGNQINEQNGEAAYLSQAEIGLGHLTLLAASKGKY